MHIKENADFLQQKPQQLPSAETNFEGSAVLLWRVISIKLNIGKKITGLEIIILKNYLACFQTDRSDV